MGITAKLDDYGQLAWITVMVLGFIAFWPIGLGILAYLIWSGRLGSRTQGGMQNMFKARGRWHGPCGGKQRSESSGNAAFDEYRADTLRRLEEEENEFHAFLDRLRQAKDKAEFDQFMADRRGRPQGPAPEAQV